VLRWLVVFSGAVYLASSRSGLSPAADVSPTPMITGVIALGLYNLLVAMLLLLGINERAWQITTFVIDGILAVGLFWASGGSPLMLVGTCLLPVIVARLRFGFGVGLASAVLLLAIDGLIAASIGTLATASGSLLIAVAFVLLVIGSMSVFGAGGSISGRDAVNVDSESKRVESAHERARAIYEMATTLGATLDYNQVLDAALDVGVLGLKEMGHDARMVGMVLLFDKDELSVITSRRLTQRDALMRVAGKHGVLGMALKQAEPVFASNAHDDAELKYFVAFQESRSVLAIPLRAGFDNYGVIVFGTDEPDAFSNEHIELLTAIGTQATIALQNAVLYQNLRDEKERIVELEEDARKKLARDLHDGPTQNVAAIAMRVNYIRRLLEKKPEEAGDELQKVEELARKTTKDIRHMLFTLRPLVLETQGLAPALEQFAQKVKETHDLDVIVQTQEGVDSLLEGHAQGVLFYIVEEAVGNARKHAQAAHIYVRLYRRENFVVVEIQDDGVGFDTGAVNNNYESRGSLGMVNMRERTALVEGVIRIESAAGKGTKIQILVPIKPDLNSQSRPNGAPGGGSGTPKQLRANPALKSRSNLKIAK